jgi:MarR family transcriptional regulator, organic hydroperoxide resistance regulator
MSDVYRTLGTTVRLLRSRLDRALQSVGLRLGQFQVMRLLWEHDGLTPRELSDRLGVEMPTVTRTVQRMLRDGLVRREAHPDDARSVRIFLAPRAHEIQEAVSSILASETEASLAGFSAAERAALVGYLERMSANAQG